MNSPGKKYCIRYNPSVQAVGFFAGRASADKDAYMRGGMRERGEKMRVSAGEDATVRLHGFFNNGNMTSYDERISFLCSEREI